jgi:hypothetical protein
MMSTPRDLFLPEESLLPALPELAARDHALTIAGDEVPLRLLLPAPNPDALPGRYELSEFDLGQWGERADFGSESSAEPTTIQSVHTATAWEHGSYIQTELLLAPEDQRTQPAIDRLHENVQENILDTISVYRDGTDWVTADHDDTIVAGHRRTLDWFRVPIITDCGLPDDLKKPCREAAITVAATDWGIAAVTIECIPATHERQACDLSTEVVKDITRRAERLATPIHAPDTHILLDWARLDDQTRTQVVGELLYEVAAAGEPTPEAVVNEAIKRYDAPQTDVRDRIDWQHLPEDYYKCVATALLKEKAADDDLTGLNPDEVAATAAKRFNAPTDDVATMVRQIQSRIERDSITYTLGGE